MNHLDREWQLLHMHSDAVTSSQSLKTLDKFATGIFFKGKRYHFKLNEFHYRGIFNEIKIGIVLQMRI